MNIPIIPHPAQLEIIESAARFKVVACGRRFGKTETGKILLINQIVRQEKPRQGWWIAPTYGMAAQVWFDLTRILEELKPKISAAHRRIELPNGSVIAFRSAHNPDLLRGAGLDYAVMDEAAFLSPKLWPEVVRPMLLDRKGGAIFLSSPYGRNHFWELYKLGLDPLQKDWQSFTFRSYDNPNIDRAEIEALKLVTPDRVFRSEYLAEFIDDMGAVFRNVEGCLTAQPDAVPDATRHVVIGVDWGRDVDYTVAAVIDADSRHLLALDRFNGISWAAARARIAALSRRWYASAVWAESNSIGQPNIEALQAEGVTVYPFNTNSRSKPELIDSLVIAFENGQIGLYPDPVLLGELASYRLERLPGGNGYRYSAPPGAHDDTVIALALAYHAARQRRFSVDFA